MSRSTEASLKVLLLLGSTLITLASIEAGLRFGYRKYEFAAEAGYQRDAERIFARKPGTSKIRQHVDTGKPYALIHNNLAMRQHRDIPASPEPDEIRIGFFGDSFTENVRVSAPHSFPEVLDHLLDTHSVHATTLNFGVDGYGIDQSYLAYRDSEAARQLDDVVYVFCANDVRNLYENRIFELNERGELIQHRPAGMRWWYAFLSRAHLTYLFVDFRNVLSAAFGTGSPSQPGYVFTKEAARQMRLERQARSHDQRADAIQSSLYQGVPSERLDGYTAIFRAVLARWRSEAQAAGARFHVVLIAREVESRLAGMFDGYDVLDLWLAFHAQGLQEGVWRFENDGHWNEFGNQFAAIELYHHLTPLLGLEPKSPEEFERELYVYYRAWPEFWQPTRGVRPSPVSEARASAIRRRYTPLEGP
jgi:hypothetical protein